MPHRDQQDNNDLFLRSIISKIEDLSCVLADQQISIKNTHSITVFCSQALAKFLGIRSEEILGKITWLPLYDNPDIETIILQEDQSVINWREQKSILKINSIGGMLKPYLCVKSPIINPATNDVVGVYVNCIENGIYNLSKLIAQNDNNLLINSKMRPYLNRREKQVVFLFISHLSSIEIAKILHKLDGKPIKKSTVDSVFNDQLYIKFSVNSRPALYDKLIELGYDKMVPNEILYSNSLAISQLKSY